MTDNTQEINEIIREMRYRVLEDNGLTVNGLTTIEQETKQAILDWHNKRELEAMIDTAFEAGFFHRIGSHSDDVGGESDKPCHCLWKEAVKALIANQVAEARIDSIKDYADALIDLFVNPPVEVGAAEDIHLHPWQIKNMILESLNHLDELNGVKNK